MNLHEIQLKVDPKVKAFYVAAKENQRIIKKKWDFQQYLQPFEKRFEEINVTNYNVQEMMIESNANEGPFDKLITELDEKLENMEQPIPDIEKAIENWEKRKPIEEKN